MVIYSRRHCRYSLVRNGHSVQERDCMRALNGLASESAKMAVLLHQFSHENDVAVAMS